MSKNILQVIPNLNFGGIEKCVAIMNKYLVKNGYNSFILTNEGQMIFKITEDGGKVIKLDIATKNPIKMFFNISKIKKILVENKIDLVDVTSRAPAISIFFACKALKIPFITTMHGNYSTGFLKNWYNSFMSEGNYIICVSNYIKQVALKRYDAFRAKYYEGKVVVVPRGVDENIFAPQKDNFVRIISTLNNLSLPQDKQIILLPGRFTDWKGQLYILDVFKKVKNKDWICLMVGDFSKHPEYKKRVEAKIKKLGLYNFIRIEKASNDMTALYSIANIVISSSIRGESFGLVSVEAQAMEKVIIATALGASLETIIDEKTGFLANVDDIDNFASIIDKVLEMPTEEKEKIGRQARENVLENYTIEKMCRDTLEVYNRLI
ncbi:MAG: glycosyltransferase family 4 protein [Rickettsiales bacterium]|nr:MAG: glycosyltransferase family 4 protein [Rickettsiales bacterium]